jgi:hypothetical protein
MYEECRFKNSENLTVSEWTGEISDVLTYQKRSTVSKEHSVMILMITKILDCFSCFVTTLSQSILLLQKY